MLCATARRSCSRSRTRSRSAPSPRPRPGGRAAARAHDRRPLLLRPVARRRRHRGRIRSWCTRHTARATCSPASPGPGSGSTCCSSQSRHRTGSAPRAAPDDRRLAGPQRGVVSHPDHRYRAVVLVVGLDGRRATTRYDASTRPRALPAGRRRLTMSSDPGVPRRSGPPEPRAAAARGRGVVPAALVPRGRGARPHRRARVRRRRRGGHARRTPDRCASPRSGSAPHHRRGRAPTSTRIHTTRRDRAQGVLHRELAHERDRHPGDRASSAG